MKTPTKVFVRKKFKEYYWNNPVKAPPQVHRREFGVGTLEDKIKIRHKAFSSDKELSDFLKREAPSYISYSAAYYEFPANQPMEAKNWLGADLVFDLDADMEYFDAGVFESVKQETLNLIGFLKDDFGFQQEDVKINFSGSKGYHLHIMNEQVRELGKDARREIVDYVTGTNLKINYFLRDIEVEGYKTDRHGHPTRSVEMIQGPTKESAGWAKRIYESVNDYIESSDLKEYRRIDGIGEKKAKQLLAEKDKNLAALRDGNWGGLVELTPRLMQKVIDERAVALTGETDKMVTIDTARLMRLPDTLHGGSGLLAVRVDDIHEFDPLVDAVVFKDIEVEVTFTKDIPEFDLMENKWGPYKKTESLRLPTYAALYLGLKDACEIG